MSDAIKIGLVRFTHERFRIVVVLVLLALSCLAWYNRFILDDAFISFRYAENLANGRGLVWNEGERVEGYTNFLWTLIVAVPLLVGIDPVQFSYITGILLFIATLTATYRLSMVVFESRQLSLIAVLMLGTNYTFSSFATGGLETQLQACLFATSTFLLLRAVSQKNADVPTMFILSCLLAAAVMTRLDSALVAAVLLASALLFVMKETQPGPKQSGRILSLVLPVMILVGGWLTWKWLYYGDFLPNTFHIRTFSMRSLMVGFYYVYLFLLSYWLIPFALICVAALKRFRDTKNIRLITLLGIVLLWILYVIVVGGDFMEFRFMVPILPFLFIVIVWILFDFIHQVEVRAVLMILVFVGSLHHALTFGVFTATGPLETIGELDGHLKKVNENWIRVGKVLGEAFPGHQDVRLATSAAGAIPFYSRLNTVDILGLNDERIATQGERTGSRPGHQRRATLEYLLERRVNLVIGHPWMVRIDSPSPSGYRAADLRRLRITVGPQRIPDESEVLEIPMDSRFKLVVLYLIHNPVVDEAIQRGGWNVIPILRDQRELQDIQSQ